VDKGKPATLMPVNRSPQPLSYPQTLGGIMKHALIVLGNIGLFIADPKLYDGKSGLTMLAVSAVAIVWVTIRG